MLIQVVFTYIMNARDWIQRCLFAPSLLGWQNGQQRAQRVGGEAVAARKRSLHHPCRHVGDI